MLNGEDKAIDTFLRISQRRARLNGLDAPQKLDLNLSIRQEMEELLATWNGGAGRGDPGDRRVG